MKKIILFIIIIAGIWSCSEDSFISFNSDRYSALNILTPKAQKNFYFIDSEQLIDTVYIDVQLVGAISDKDRFFKVGLIDSLTTASEGIHFEPLQENYLFPADQYESSFSVLVKRDLSMLDSIFTIGLMIMDNETFIGSMEGYSFSQIEVLDYAYKPEWWSMQNGALENSWWGRYHPKKHELLLNLYGVPQDEVSDWVPPISDAGTLSDILLIMKKFFQDNIYFHEDGERVTIPYSI